MKRQITIRAPLPPPFTVECLHTYGGIQMSQKTRPRTLAASSRPLSKPSSSKPSSAKRQPSRRSPSARRRRRRTLVVSSLAGLTFFAVVTMAVLDQPSMRGFSTSPTAWKLPPQAGGPAVSLDSLRGHPVIVNFFASWCQVCADELPVFAADARLLRGRVDVVEVNALETGNGTAFADRFHLSGAATAVLSDVGGSQGDGLYQALGGSGTMPMTAFYSSSGQLLGTHVGGYDAQTLASAVRGYYGVTLPA